MNWKIRSALIATLIFSPLLLSAVSTGPNVPSQPSVVLSKLNASIAWTGQDANTTARISISTNGGIWGSEIAVPFQQYSYMLEAGKQYQFKVKACTSNITIEPPPNTSFMQRVFFQSPQNTTEVCSAWSTPSEKLTAPSSAAGDSSTGADPDFITSIPTVGQVIIPSENLESTSILKVDSNVTVSDTGAANVSVPILIPKGAGDFTPSVSLQYSSMSGSGLVGAGWNLVASSVISRCEKNLETDGNFQQIFFDDRDAICLNGTKLRLVSGLNLKDGAEYRLDDNPSVKALQIGSGSSGYFVVSYPNGEKEIYGNTYDSVLNHSVNSSIYLWKLSKRTNAYSRVINFEYQGKNNNSLILTNIKYDGNIVSFNYNERPDYVVNYYWGNKVTEKYILDSISVKNYTLATVRYYKFNYELSQYSALSLLKEFFYCDSEQQLVCTQKTRLDYSDYNYAGLQNYDYVIDLKQYTSLPNPVDTNNCSHQWNVNGYEGKCGIQRLEANDINGDGISELIVSSYFNGLGKILTFNYENQGFTLNPNYKIEKPLTKYSIPDQAIEYYFQWELIDQNGDGILEFSFPGGYTNDGTVHYDWDGDGIDENSPQTGEHVDQYRGTIFNHDVYTTIDVLPFGRNNVFRERIIDVNHDGLMDRAVPVPTYSINYEPETGDVDYTVIEENWAIELATIFNGQYRGVSPLSIPQITNIFRDTNLWGDFNGDGYLDSDRKPNIGLNYNFTSEVSSASNYLCYSNASNNQCFEAYSDIDGDGLGDYVYRQGNDLYFSKSKSDRFLSSTLLTSTNWPSKNPHESSYIWADLDGDAQPDFVFYHHGMNRLYIRMDNNTQNIVLDKLITIDTGLDKKYEIEYSRLNDSNVYQIGKDNTPKAWGNGSVVRNVGSSLPVVKSIKEATVIENRSPQFDETTYTYEALRTQMGGKGSLGFAKVVSYQSSNKKQITKEFRQDGKFANLNFKTEVRIEGILLESQEVTEWNQYPVNNGQSTLVFPKTTISNKYFINGQNGVLSDSELASETVVTNLGEITQAGYYRETSNKVTVNDYFDSGRSSTTTTFSYSDEDILKWFIARPTMINTEHSRTGASNTIKTLQNFYDSFGRIRQVVTEPNSLDPQIFKVTDFKYDTYGNAIQETTCSIHFKSSCDSAVIPSLSDDSFKVFRRKYYDYDANGRYLMAKRNSIYSEAIFSDYNKFGLPETIRKNIFDNSSGQVESYVYDKLGQVYFSYTNTGSTKKITKWLCVYDASCPDNATFAVRSESDDDVVSVKYLDLSERVVRERDETLNGGWRYVDRVFDLRGREIQSSSPYLQGGAVFWQQQLFDSLDRKLRVTTADYLVTSFSYNRGTLQQTVEGRHADPRQSVGINQQRNEIKNGRDEVIESIDEMSRSVFFSYNSLGLLSQVINVDGTVSSTEYDVLGRRVRLQDPSKGLITTSFNALDETIKSVEAGSTSTEIKLNSIGQIVSRTVSNGSEMYTSIFDYKNSPLLHSETSSSSSTSYVYDNYHRLSLKTYQIDGKQWTDSTKYDQFGRIFRTMDISGSGRGLQYQYKNGVVHSIFEVQTGKSYYRALNSDAFGNIDDALFGNSIKVKKNVDSIYGRLRSLTAQSGLLQNLSFAYDSIGNLRYRAKLDSFGGVKYDEAFDYDSLNRLSKGSLNGVNTLSVSYYDNGNIRSKSDVQSNSLYSYGQLNSGCSVKPGAHALTQVGSNLYCYDQRGNQIKQISNGVSLRSVQYNVFNKPTAITSTKGVSTFTYDSSYNIAKRVDSLSGSASKTTYYVGGHEVIYSGDGTNEIKRYLGDFAIQSIKSTGQEQLVYVLRDHIGSASVYSDATGKVIEEASFDPFGMRRGANWQALLNPNNLKTLQAITERGFTNHIQIDHANIVHMGGRIYDPYTGRFLQADPFVEEPRDAQTLNRYSYVLNNPLSYTDPTGYLCDSQGKRHAQECGSSIDNGWTQPENRLPSNWAIPNEYRKMTSSIEGKKRTTAAASGVMSARLVAANSTVNISNGLRLLGGLGVRLVANVFGMLLPMNVTEHEDGTPVGELRNESRVEDRKQYRVIVIGETQKRVEAMATLLRKGGFNPETILNDWPKNLLPSNDLDGSLEFNRRWINEKMDENYTIYDVGLDPSRKNNRSIFYKMEKREIEIRGYTNQFGIRLKE